MRGQGILLGLALLALVVPVASALVDEGPTASSASPSIRWMAPSYGYVDHPVHAAVGVYDEAGLVGHASLHIVVTLGDRVLFTTEDVHEHDGFHTIVITPPAAGVLRFEARPGFHEDEASAGQRDASVVTEVPIRVAPGDPMYEMEPVRLHPAFHPQDDPDDPIALWAGAHHDRGHGALFDLADSDGRLLASGWGASETFHVSWLWPPIGGYGDGTLHALVTSPSLSNHTIFTETLQRDMQQGDLSLVRATYPLPEPECADQDVPIVVDPNPVLDGTRTWQQWTDLRFALDTDEYLNLVPMQRQLPRLSYTFMAMQPVPAEDAWGGLSINNAFGAFREHTTRFTEPGHYRLDVTLLPPGQAGQASRTTCTIYFQILPNTDNDPGTVDHLISVRNDAALVQFLAKRDGDSLPHYEFDTRVVKLHTEDTPGRLVWKGKLHGHLGHAMFEVGGLDPGDYEVRTYPSPQDLGTPPVAAPTDEGFVYRFTIEAPPEPDPVMTEVEPQTAPMVGPVVLLALVLLTARLRPSGRA